MLQQGVLNRPGGVDHDLEHEGELAGGEAGGGSGGDGAPRLLALTVGPTLQYMAMLSHVIMLSPIPPRSLVS